MGIQNRPTNKHVDKSRNKKNKIRLNGLHTDMHTC